jgi:cytochrome c oxidase assembly protein subunit 11
VKRPGNAVLGGVLAALVLGMFSFAYANVPLFKIFCSRFGLGGAGKAAWKGALAPAMSSSTGPVESRNISVRFMGVTASGLPVRFGPSTPMVTVNPGRPVHLSYTFTNLSQDSVFFRAVHSIVPLKAAREFQLIQCFCFEDQSLGPRETRTLPVYFALSPRVPVGIDELTLSYTLFPRDPTKSLPVPASEAN